MMLLLSHGPANTRHVHAGQDHAKEVMPLLLEPLEQAMTADELGSEE